MPATAASDQVLLLPIEMTLRENVSLPPETAKLGRWFQFSRAGQSFFGFSALRAANCQPNGAENRKM
jgi:hypothetical protein